jgi:hypothetical protein
MSNWALEFFLNAEGLSAEEKAQVEAALPALNEMITLVNANRPFLEKMLQLWAIVGPAAQTVTSHLKG